METAAVRMTEIEGRGRAMVALRPLKGGEIVLKDSPIILYSAFSFLSDDHQKSNGYCSHCFITVSQQSQKASCSTCGCGFCSLECQSVASATSHTPWVCQALFRFRQYVSDHDVGLDLQLQARFLVSAYNLASVSPVRFQTLLSLQGSVSSQPDADSSAVFLHSFISSLCATFPRELGFSLELTCVLLAKDKLNAFGLMEPFSEEREERSVRAYGIYPLASFFNHDCLPNACRFDYIDVAGPASSNTDITIRMIHDVPQGREICLSYFPVNLKYSERQKRLRDDYGFVCECDRCKVEANWSDCDEDDDLDVDDNNEEEDDEEPTAVMDEDPDVEMEGEDGDAMKGEDDFPHAYFFLTYMCDRKNCWGTLAPVTPSVATTSIVMECNVCGYCKNLDQV
ncbi:histone-lysine N-methyltransferase ASHR2 [Cynara cardunculus var. scolymus]|uniref:SET domain-containing protein n=1 Tax=Cynara cardunculus var. scolymus TaxID=59895 RepID=A0A103XRW5_CYNCS|nr:histone-lysine N-methyltransferase ASHR2 [Cynara cardunculus var. scolymus]KVH95746.1 SET domain-containing protein [Cynara cardunculus var. scolymus]